MNKNNKVIKICIAIVCALILVALALGVADLYKNNWTFSTDNVKPALIIIGLFLTLVRLVSNLRPKRPLEFYESHYKEHIERAFSDSDQQKDRKTLLRALAYFGEHDMGNALKLLSELKKKCRRSDDYRTVLFFQAAAYSDSDMATKAIETYNELLSYDPYNSTAWSNLGIIHMEKGDYKAAITHFTNATKYDPKNAYAWNNLAQLYMSECEWEEVIEPATKAIELNPKMYQSYTALTAAY